MYNYKVLICDYVFDVKSLTQIYPSEYFESTIFDGLNVLKLNYNSSLFGNNEINVKYLKVNILACFIRTVMIINTQNNQNIARKIIETEHLENIVSIINYTSIDINAIEGFDILRFELTCKNDTLKRFLRLKINNNVSENERKKIESEFELTIEKMEDVCTGFQWINKDLDLFMIENVKNIQEFDAIYAPKFGIPPAKFRQQRLKIFAHMAPPANSICRIDIIGQVLNKPINKNKGKILQPLVEIARKAISTSSDTEDED